MDPVHVAARCTHRTGAKYGDCAVGSRCLRNVTKAHARRVADRAMRRGMVNAMNKWRPASSRAIPLSGDSVEDDADEEGERPPAALPATGRSLYIDGEKWAQGGRTFVVLRVQFAGMADTSRVINASRAAGMCAEIGPFLRNASYGQLSPNVICPSSCVYRINVTEAQAAANPYMEIADEAVAVALQSTGSCRLVLPVESYNVIFLQPYIDSLGWAGIGLVPGRYSWVNGDKFTERWLWAHESAHNFGLWHAYSWDPLLDAPVEYGDLSAIMGSNRITYPGISYLAAEKEQMGWLPQDRVVDLTTAVDSRTNSTTVTLAGIDRADGHTLNASTALAIRWPAANGAWRQFVYAQFRPAFARAGGSALLGVQMHEAAADFKQWSDGSDDSSDRPTYMHRTTGQPTLLDTTPSTIDQLDAVVSPGDAFIYGQVSASLPPLLVEPLAEPTGNRFAPAGSLAPGDRLQRVRMTWLDPTTLERTEGRGCSASSCQLSLNKSTLPPITCGMWLYGPLDPIRSRVYVFVIRPMIGTATQMVRLSSCGTSSINANTAVGVYTSLPAAQALYGASFGRGALAFSDSTLTGTRPYNVSMCGTLVVPLTSARPLYVAFGLTAAGWALVRNGDVPAQVDMLMSCGASLTASSPPRYVSVASNTLSQVNGVYQLLSGNGTLLNGRPRWHRMYRFEMADIFLEHRTTGWGVYKKNPTMRGIDETTLESYIRWSSSSYEVTSLAVTLNSDTVSIRYACPPASYESTGSCVPCPAFRWSPAGSTSSSACVCEAGAGRVGSTCAPCAVNSYKPSASNATCLACPAGTNTVNATGSTSYWACKQNFCDAYAISGLFDTSLNGLFINADISLRNVPIYVRTSDQLLLVYVQTSDQLLLLFGLSDEIEGDGL